MPKKPNKSAEIASFTLHRKQFLEALKKVALPDFKQGLSIKATRRATHLCATTEDGCLSVAVKVPGVSARSACRFALPLDCVKIVQQFLSCSADDAMHFSSKADQEWGVLRGKRDELKFPLDLCIECEFSLAAQKKYHEMPARMFREVVRRTVFATDTESSHYALGGVLLELGETGMTAVATDRRRLARQESPAQSVGGHSTGDSIVIVPTRAMQLLERALANNEKNVHLTVNDNYVIARSGQITVRAGLLKGTVPNTPPPYPHWRALFPRDECAAKATLTVGPFFAAVRRAAAATTKERRDVVFTFGGGKVALTARREDWGEVRVEMPIEYDGPAIAVTLNALSVSEFLHALSPDQTITFEYRHPDRAVCWNTDDGFSYLLMPIAPSTP